jgi:hypothetical protein
MNAQEIVKTLRKLGKPQTAAIYKRYGTGDNVFGVLTSEIAKLQKKIKVDQTARDERRADRVGVYKPALRQKALEAAKRIGKVDVDHGGTNCTTPDAGPYILKAAKRKNSR